MHSPSFKIWLLDVLKNEEMKNLVRRGALLKNISILAIMMRAKQDQF